MLSRRQAWRKIHHFASNLSISFPASPAFSADLA